MSEAEAIPMEALAALVQSEAFASVKAAVEALDPTIMLDASVAPHLKAFRTGMNALAAVPALQPAAEEPPAE